MFLPNFSFTGNSMSNHPGHDTPTSQILFIFSLYVDNVDMIHENFSPQLLTVSKLLRFENLTEMGVPG